MNSEYFADIDFQDIKSHRTPSQLKPTQKYLKSFTKCFKCRAYQIEESDLKEKNSHQLDEFDLESRQ